MSHEQDIRPVSDRTEPFKRGDVLTRIEVDCRPTCMPAPGGYLLNFGKQTLTVKSDDVKFFQALVEQEPEKLDEARKRFQKKLDKFVADGIEGIDEPTAKALRTEQLIGSYANSVEATFYDSEGRDMKPLISCKILQENIVPSVNEAENVQAAMIAEIVARAVANAMQAIGVANATQSQPQPQNQKR